MQDITQTPSARIQIGWFASGFVGRASSGTSYLAHRAITMLLENFPDKFELILFTRNEIETESIKKNPEFSQATVVELPSVRGNFMQSSRQFYKFCRLKPMRIDILHFSAPRVYPFFWLFPAEKFFCTFHAAGDVTVKSDKFVLSKHIYNLIIKLQWKHFDAIIALSEFARKEIIDNYGVAKSGVRIIPPGADSFMKAGERPVEELRDKKSLIVVMGRWQTFKNVGQISKAMYLLNNQLGNDFHLVLLGKSKVLGGENVRDIIKDFDARNFTAIEYLEPDELNWLFLNSRMIIVPSLNEGFGLPSFEAYAGGATVLVHEGTPASTILVSEAGVFSCDMQDLKKFADVTKSVLNSTVQIDRAARERKLEELGITWETYAEKIAQLYLENSRY
jgi:glycosyltransferase involved in cell wall biosynthesis